MYNPLHVPRRYELIVETIKQQILAGELKAGDKLPSENELALQFNVSRTVLRDAIKSLKKEGLVEVRHGLGTFVTNNTSQALSNSLDLMLSMGSDITTADLAEIREMLEPAIAALAAARATPGDIEQLRQAVDEMNRHMGDAEDFIAADHMFHSTLAHATSNALVPLLLNPIVDLLHSHRRATFSMPGAPEKAQYYHQLILEAIEKGNSEAASDAMLSHLKYIRESEEKHAGSLD